MGDKKDSVKLQIMVPQIERIEYIVTDSEIEALILEAELIKKHKPKYNILLKDDKKFPYFVITKEDYPRIIIARAISLIHSFKFSLIYFTLSEYFFCLSYFLPYVFLL